MFTLVFISRKFPCLIGCGRAIALQVTEISWEFFCSVTVLLENTRVFKGMLLTLVSSVRNSGEARLHISLASSPAFMGMLKVLAKFSPLAITEYSTMCYRYYCGYLTYAAHCEPSASCRFRPTVPFTSCVLRASFCSGF
jgi:hypothetical protein